MSISFVEFLEINQNSEETNLLEFTGLFETGDIISFQSTLGEVDVRRRRYPKGMQVSMIGENADGDEIFFSVSIFYTNSCDDFPVLTAGQTMGWLTIVSAQFDVG